MTALLLVVLVIGCSTASKSVTYFSLNSIDAAGRRMDRSADLAGRVLGVGPISLPAYLDRLQIVTRTGANQLRVDDYHRWAAPLNEEIRRVVSEDLKALTGVETVLPYPWSLEQRPALAVELQIHAFEGQADGQAILNATAVFRDFRHPSSSAPVQRTYAILHEARTGHGEDLISALNQTLNDLSRQIADEIESLIR
jgi:hypothetical protein